MTTGPAHGGAAAVEPWQIRLYRHSIKKRETIGAVLRLLPSVAGLRCLEIGCSTGISSWFLLRRGGAWTLTDFDPTQAESARQLLGADVRLIDVHRLPFPDASFDVVVGINFLEHVEDDAGFVGEIARVLRPGGAFVLACHEAATGRLGYRLKRLYGITAEGGGFGLARDGYRRAELERLLRGGGLVVERLVSYSRLFTEVVENSLNYVYSRSAARKAAARNGAHGADRFHGGAVPVSAEDFESVGWTYRLYERVYPALRGVSLLDRLVPFHRGYMFCVRARKPASA